MILRLVREPTIDAATLGALYVDRHFECWCLEDAIRERPDEPVAAWKVPGRTAIPAGHYRLDITLSNRFHRLLPILLEVPGFTGVRIHPGNVIADTDGCLLVGRTRAVGAVGESRLAFEALLPRLKAHLQYGLWITVENPPAMTPMPMVA